MDCMCNVGRFCRLFRQGETELGGVAERKICDHKKQRAALLAKNFSNTKKKKGR